MLKEGRGPIILSIANPQDKHCLVPPEDREEQFKLEEITETLFGRIQRRMIMALYNSQLLSCERKIIQNAFSECRSESKEEIIQGRIRRANIKKENE